MPETKVCTGCKRRLSADNFYPKTYKSKTTGEPYLRLRPKCKRCDAEIQVTNRNTAAGRARRLAYRTKNKGSISYWAKERVSIYRRQTPGSDLTSKYLVDLFNAQNGRCYYTGVPLVFPSKPGVPDGISLDKMTPKRGYVVGNVVFCAFRVNTMKGPLSERDFYKTMRRILRLAARRKLMATGLDPTSPRPEARRGR